MPAVFVHGVPDTTRVWQPLLAQLKRKDVICLSLPGFGNKRPAGFSPDKDTYARWLVNELKKIEGPIDLVGHDWGSLLVTRTVSLEPNLVRTWCGGGAPLDPEYVWHATAKIWQTPDKGEEFMKIFGGEPMAQALSTQGVPITEARESVRLIDDEMKTCILALYRSATRVADDWFPDLARARTPSLIVWGENDPYASATFGQRLAQNAKGEFTAIPGTGHWYQHEKPEFVATQLEAFWSRHT